MYSSKKWISALFAFSLMMLLSGCFSGINSNNQSGLSADPSHINITVASTVSFTLHNNTDSTFTGITVTPSSNLSGLGVYGNCDTLPAQGQCVLRLAAKPNATIGTGSLTVNSQNTSLLTIPIQVSLPVNYSLTVDKMMLALYQNAGSTSLTLTNNGNAPLTDIAFNNLPAGVIATGSCSSLAVNAQCTFTLTANSNSTVNNYTATLSASEITPLTLHIQISPENQGPTATTLTVNPSSVPLAAGTTETLTLTNSGDNALDGSLIINSGTLSNDVIITPAQNCTNLAAHAGCNVAISAPAGTPSAISSIIFSAQNTSNSASATINVGSSILSLPQSSFSIEQEGTLEINVTNNSSTDSAESITLSSLPQGVSRTDDCTNIAANSSCNLEFSAPNASPGSSNITLTYEDNGVSFSIPFTLTVSEVGIVLQTPADNNIYVPVNGNTGSDSNNTNTIIIQNNSTATKADNVTVTSGLPPNVTTSTCNSIDSNGGTCTITLTATSASPSNNNIITIQGTNTNPVNISLTVEQPSSELSIQLGNSSNDLESVNFPSYGEQSLTVVNNSHFKMDHVTPSVSDTDNFTINSSTCSTLTPTQSCAFNLSAAANASASSNPGLSVSGRLSTNNGGSPVSQEWPISLSPPVITFANNAQTLSIPGELGEITSIPVTVGNFNIQNPRLSLSLGDNTTNNYISYSLQDATNPKNPCSDPYDIGSDCVIVLSNNNNLDASGTNGNGTLSIGGSNLVSAAMQNVSVADGLAISYVSLSGQNAGTYYGSTINGPRYGIVVVTNNSMTDSYSFNANSINLSDTTNFTLDSTRSDYGSNTQCGANTILAKNGGSCIVIFAANTKTISAVTGTLSISAMNSVTGITTSRTFTLTSTGYLYAGGNFTSPGANIAVWNGSIWSVLSNGPSGTVSALTTDNAGNLYAGGSFASPGANIAEWNGSTWLALGSGVSGGSINALATDNLGNLYAGGGFNFPGSHIAKWNSARRDWSALGSGVSGGNVSALATDSSGNVYAGGNFQSPNAIAECNSGGCTAVGSGVSGGYIYGLAMDNSSGNLYAGGNISSPGSGIAKWNPTGGNWFTLGTGISSGGIAGSVYSLTIDSDKNAYAGGLFTNAGGVSVNSVAEWNGNSWSALSGTSPLYGNVITALATDSAKNLYIGGNFTITVSGKSANHIVQWRNPANGGGLSVLGSGIMGGNISALAIVSVLQVQ